MSILDELNNYINDYTDEMEEWFNERTNRHIGLVNKYAGLIEQYDSEFNGLSDIAEEHDKSKFDDIERIPYIYISWNYHCKDIGKEYFPPSDIKEKMNDATLHHVKNNKHHPEYWDKDSKINKDNRNVKPDKIVDATMMSEMAIGEMIADWMAMSEEKGNTVKEWADKNVNVRWKFTDPQTKLIYELIENVKDEE